MLIHTFHIRTANNIGSSCVSRVIKNWHTRVLALLDHCSTNEWLTWFANRSEVNVIHRLLEAEVNLSQAKLKESFLALNQTDVALESWHFKFGYDVVRLFTKTHITLLRQCLKTIEMISIRSKFWPRSKSTTNPFKKISHSSSTYINSL